MLGRAWRHNVDVACEHDRTSASAPFENPAEIRAAFEGASFAGPRTAFVFRVKRGPVRFPEIGREAERLQALLEIELAIALTWTRVARIRFDDRRIADDSQRVWTILCERFSTAADISLLSSS